MLHIHSFSPLNCSSPFYIHSFNLDLCFSFKVYVYLFYRLYVSLLFHYSFQMLLTSSYTHEFTGIPFVPYANYEARLTTFYQGQSSPFANNINQIKCQKSIVPLPPTIVMEINVTDFTYLHDNIVDLTISWIPPEYINGHDVIYSLWVGSKALSIDTGLPSGSTLNDEIRYMKDMDVSVCPTT